MAQRCPRCRLFSPDEALRCDCGYDFTTQTLRKSYVLADLAQKHAHQPEVLRRSARRLIWTGVALLAIAGVLTLVFAKLASGVWILAAVMLVYRGVMKRRLVETLERMQHPLQTPRGAQHGVGDGGKSSP